MVNKHSYVHAVYTRDMLFSSHLEIPIREKVK